MLFPPRDTPSLVTEHFFGECAVASSCLVLPFLLCGASALQSSWMEGNLSPSIFNMQQLHRASVPRVALG